MQHSSIVKHGGLLRTFLRGDYQPSARAAMAHSGKAIAAAVVVGVVSAVAHSQSRRLWRRSKGSKRQQRGQQRTEPNGKHGQQLASAQSEPEVLFDKLFGEDRRLCVVVEAVADRQVAADNTVADKETFKAIKQLLALLLAAFSCICFLAVAVATGSFASLAAALVVAYVIAKPAAVGVRRYYGRALNEALDESIKTTGAPWDLAVI